MNERRMKQFVFASRIYVIFILLMIFSNHIFDLAHDDKYKIERTSISQSDLNRPMYLGPDHRWTGRLDGADLVPYKPRFENHDWTK